MAWPPRVVEAMASVYGPASTVHTAMPPFGTGGDLVDVAEHRRPDGSVVYATAGLSEGGGWSAKEMLLHAKAPDARLPELMARLGGSTRHRQYVSSGTLPLAGPADADLPFDAVGFLYAGRNLRIGETNVSLQQVVGLTREELEVARRESLYTVEAAFWRDGVFRVAEPGRPTSPSLASLLPVHPPPEALASLSWDARDMVEAVIAANHDDCEMLRMKFPEADACVIARELAERLPHPAQLASLLHALMDFTIEELRRPALRLLQVPPDDYMAGQYYADALAMLGALDGEKHWDVYDRYAGDVEAARAAAEAQRADAGLEIAFPAIP